MKGGSHMRRVTDLVIDNLEHIITHTIKMVAFVMAALMFCAMPKITDVSPSAPKYPLPPCVSSDFLAAASHSIPSNDHSPPVRVTGPGTASELYRAQGDLLIPFYDEHCNFTLAMGDSFVGNLPGEGIKRSPVLLHAGNHLMPGQPIPFTGASGIIGPGIAPAVMDGDNIIPTDGISLPGQEFISYMKIKSWDVTDTQGWSTSYSGIAWSPDGNHFQPIPSALWQNDPDNQDPYQMMSLQRSGSFIYVVSVRAGRQMGPMMIQRLPLYGLYDKADWQCWTGGDEWVSTMQNPSACQPLFDGKQEQFGEPSLRLLAGGIWALSYLNVDYPNGEPHIVTRWALSPTGPWSDEKTQLTWSEDDNLYGGFIVPSSTAQQLILMVSKWNDRRYDVSMIVRKL